MADERTPDDALATVLARYEQELADLDREYQVRRGKLATVVATLRDDLARTTKVITSATSATSGRPYAGLKVLEASVRYLESVSGPADAGEIAAALLRGGYQPKGNPDNFRQSVYNTLKTESDKHAGKVKQTEDKRFRLATDVDVLPEPGPGSQNGIALPSQESGSVPPVFVPTGFGGAARGG